MLCEWRLCVWVYLSQFAFAYTRNPTSGWAVSECVCVQEKAFCVGGSQQTIWKQKKKTLERKRVEGMKKERTVDMLVNL